MLLVCNKIPCTWHLAVGSLHQGTMSYRASGAQCGVLPYIIVVLDVWNRSLCGSVFNLSHKGLTGCRFKSGPMRSFS